MPSELEYCITFPWRDEKARKPSETREPVVILLGWAQSTDGELAEYSAIYEQSGYICISYSIPFFPDMFFGQRRLRRTAAKIYDVIADHELEKHPIFIHIFGAGGQAMYRHFLEAMQAEESVPDGKGRTLQVAGVIFDSAPVQTGFFGVIKSYMNSLRVSAVLKPICGLFLGLYVLFHYVWHIIKRMFFFPGCAVFTTWDIIRADKSRCPELFLGSTADAIATPKSVKYMVEQRKNRGVDVTSVVWDDSAHLEHMQKHREAYAAQCYGFISQIMGARLNMLRYTK
ncbi:transmembrane protein 53-like [Lingula anatina]|uniref:Transmembrane protein 53-like n=1 Tax=Lingula anatina TaxID=7574 RepID=A0A1S3K6Z6_LINAN|nr:transmembrane protein 53-like [Lingula anatina]|eukprot:XP_013418031.1 transmembrane protein 53-like [Lingula anatina]